MIGDGGLVSLSLISCKINTQQTKKERNLKWCGEVKGKIVGVLKLTRQKQKNKQTTELLLLAIAWTNNNDDPKPMKDCRAR